jgi:predicted nucleic acid-binding protein
MTNFWVDANLILRFLTQEPVQLAERALRFFYLAEIARQTGYTVASFDKDFRRLDIPWHEPM